MVFPLVLNSCTVREVQMKNQAVQKKIEEQNNLRRKVSVIGKIMQIRNDLIDNCFRLGKLV